MSGENLSFRLFNRKRNGGGTWVGQWMSVERAMKCCEDAVQHVSLTKSAGDTVFGLSRCFTAKWRLS